MEAAFGALAAHYTTGQEKRQCLVHAIAGSAGIPACIERVSANNVSLLMQACTQGCLRSQLLASVFRSRFRSCFVRLGARLSHSLCRFIFRFRSAFGSDFDRNLDYHLSVQTHRDCELASLLNRLAQIYAATINVVAATLQSFSDVH